MTEDRADLMLEILKTLQAGQNRLEEKIDSLSAEFVAIKQHMAAFMKSECNQDRDISALTSASTASNADWTSWHDR
mgnify:CR=1 FL=1